MNLTVKTEEQLRNEGWKYSAGRYYKGLIKDRLEEINSYDMMYLSGKKVKMLDIDLSRSTPFVSVCLGKRTTRLPWTAFVEDITPDMKPDNLVATKKFTHSRWQISHIKVAKLWKMDTGYSEKISDKGILEVIKWVASQLGYKVVKA